MYSFSAFGSLSDKITVGTARAAYSFVFSCLCWQLRFDTLDPPALDIDAGDDFDQVLAGRDSWDFKDQARGWVASRVQDLAVAVNERRLRSLGLDVAMLRSSSGYRETALIRIRENIKNQIRAEIDDRFDDRLSTWEAKMEQALAMTDDATRDAVITHVGFDQRVEPKPLKSAVNYVFDRLGLRVVPYGSSLVVLGESYRISAIRKAVASDDPRDRANSLVLRAVDALIDGRRHLDGASSSDVLVEIRSVVKDLTTRHGCLGLIDVVKRRSLASGKLEELAVDCPVLTRLVRDQRERLSEMSIAVLGCKRPAGVM